MAPSNPTQRQSHRLIQNAFFNSLGQVARLASGLVLPPFVVARIGADGYGTVVMLASVLFFISMVQVGTPQALNRFVAVELTLDRREELNRLLSTGLALLTAAAGIASILLLFVVALPRTFLSFPDSLSIEDVRWIVVIMGAVTILSIPLSLGVVAFYVTERFRAITGIRIGATVLRVVLVFAMLWSIESSVLVYVVASSLGVFAGAFAIGVVGWRLLPRVRLRPRYVDRETLRRITGFGVEIFLNMLLFMLFIEADYLIIGKTLGSAQVTILSLAILWGMVLRQIAGTAMTVLTPATASRDALGETESLRTMFVRSTKYMLLIGMLPVLFLCVFRYRLVLAWMGEGFDETAALLLPLLVADLLTLTTQSGNEICYALGKIRRFTIVNTIFGVTNVVAVLVITGVLHLGLPAVAWTYFAIFLARSGIVVPIWMARGLQLSPWSYYRKSYGGPLTTALVAIPLLLLLERWLPEGGWGLLLLAGALFSLVFVPLAYLLALDSYDRRVFVSMAGQFLRSFRRPPTVPPAPADGDTKR